MAASSRRSDLQLQPSAFASSEVNSIPLPYHIGMRTFVDLPFCEGTFFYVSVSAVDADNKATMMYCPMHCFSLYAQQSLLVANVRIAIESDIYAGVKHASNQQRDI